MKEENLVIFNPKETGVFFGPYAQSFSENSLVWKFTFGPMGSLFPLEPLLGWFQCRFLDHDKKTWLGLVQKAGFYGPHGRFFLTWLNTGEAKRVDYVPFFPAEHSFERDLWFAALGKMADILAKKDEIWFWNDIQNAGPGILRFIFSFHKLKGRKNLRIICNQTGKRPWKINRSLDPWFSFLATLDKDQRYLRHHDSTFQETTSKIGKTLPMGDFFKRSLIWQSPEDALGYGEEEAENHAGLWGEVLMTTGYTDQAAVFLQMAWEHTSQKNSPKEKTLVGLTYVRLLGQKKDLVEAYRILDILEEEAKKHPLTTSNLELKLHRFFLDDLNSGSTVSSEGLEELQTELRGKKLLNILSYTESLMPIYSEWLRQGNWDYCLDYAKKALKRAMNAGNLYRASVFHHVLGYIHEYKGDQKNALPFFQEGIRLRQKLGDPIELIKVYNGTGYYCFTVGELALGLKYFSKALALLKDTKDFTETCLTIFNMTLISIFSGMPNDALTLLETLLEVMDTLGFTALPWHKKSKIQALAAWAAYRSGHRTLAYEYLDTIKDLDIDQEALPWVCLARGTLGLGSIWFDRGLEATEKGNLKYLQIQLKVEAILSKEPQDKTALSSVAKAAREINLELQAQWIESLYREVTNKKPQKIKQETLVLLASLKSSAQREAANQKFREKIREINFLRNFQVQITSELDERAFVTMVKKQIKNKFSLKTISFKITTPHKAIYLEKFLICDLPLEGARVLRLQLESRSDQGFSPEDRRMFELAMNHMALVWSLKKAKEALNQAAALDPLTGILARREIMERLELERKRILRYAHQKSPGFALLFIDLDNFKFYNDTYGHAVGDWILKKFCQLVKTVLRDLDLIGRYGEDEFIVILPETVEPGALITSERILVALRKAQGFDRELAVHLGGSLKIPQEKYLGCSIGIGIFNPKNPLNTDDLLKLADKRLYIAKQQGKNRYYYAEGND